MARRSCGESTIALFFPEFISICTKIALASRSPGNCLPREIRLIQQQESLTYRLFARTQEPGELRRLTFSANRPAGSEPQKGFEKLEGKGCCERRYDVELSASALPRILRMIPAMESRTWPFRRDLESSEESAIVCGHPEYSERGRLLLVVIKRGRGCGHFVWAERHLKRKFDASH